MNDVIFEQLEKQRSKTDPTWLKSLRKQAWANFKQWGFPTRRSESWKYTSLQSWIETDLISPVFPGAHSSVAIESLGLDDSYKLFFVDGFFSPALSQSLEHHLPSGVIVSPLSKIFSSETEKLETCFRESRYEPDQALLAMNLALFQDGFFIFIPRHLVLEKPIEVFFLHSSAYPNTLLNYRNYLTIEVGGQASVIEHHIRQHDLPIYTNVVTEVVSKENSHLAYYKMQQEASQGFHCGHTHIRQKSDSHTASYFFSLGGQWVRNETAVVLEAAGAQCDLNGLYWGKKSQHLDNQLRVDHASPHCISRQVYKGILEDQAQAVFNGNILVRPHASKTEAYQTNNNLLLSPEAQINTKPLLEIFNNDVKCHHGATIGRLEENQIFYLRSRGLELEAAKRLLTEAFANELTDAIASKPIQEKTRSLIRTYLSGASR